jgi:hypothetical protein
MALATNYYKKILSDMHDVFVEWEDELTKGKNTTGTEKRQSAAMAERITVSSWKSTKANEYAKELQGMIYEMETMWTTTKDDVWTDWYNESEKVEDEGEGSWRTKSNI